MKKRKICNFGKIVIKKLVDLDQNQAWLATSINATEKQISSYVTGRNAPNAVNLYLISKVLNIDSNVLLESIVRDKKVS